MDISKNSTKKFEDSFSEYVDSPYAVSLSSGTAALHLSLLALGLKPGDEMKLGIEGLGEQVQKTISA